MNMDNEILPHEKDKLKCILCCGFYPLNQMTIILGVEKDEYFLPGIGKIQQGRRTQKQYCSHCVPNEFRGGC